MQLRGTVADSREKLLTFAELPQGEVRLLDIYEH